MSTGAGNRLIFLIKSILILLFSLFAATVQAETVIGIDFQHKDWILVCDNTRTCRAAGYQDAFYQEQEEGEPVLRLVTMLLTREAGPNTPVSIELQARDEENGEISQMRLRVGELVVPEITCQEELPRETAAQLLAVMPDKEEVILSTEDRRWHLSLAGIKAVLLKMDEFQGRIGTPGALIGKGNKPETGVPPPLQPKTLIIPPIPPTTEQDKKVLAALGDFLDQECDKNEVDRKECNDSRSLHRLSKDKLLVSQVTVSSGAANYNDQLVAFWMINDKPPYHPRPAYVEDEDAGEQGALAHEYHDGVMSYSIIGGGVMISSWDYASWVWTGKTFELAEESSEVGGGFAAWSMPKTVNSVINKNEN